MGTIGNLADFSLANILQMFESSAKSGRLSINAVEGTHKIWFYQGRIIAAISSNPSENLRKFLQFHPESAPELRQDLSSALLIDKPLGLHLQERQLISPELLAEGFQHQLQIVMNNIINSTKDEFQFTSGLPFPYLDMTGLSKSSLEVALQGLRQADTENRLAVNLPKADSFLLRLIQGLSLASLSPLEWSIWQQISLESSIANIAERLDRSLLDIQQACSRLIDIGLIEEVTARRRRELIEVEDILNIENDINLCGSNNLE